MLLTVNGDDVAGYPTAPIHKDSQQMAINIHKENVAEILSEILLERTMLNHCTGFILMQMDGYFIKNNIDYLNQSLFTRQKII